MLARAADDLILERVLTDAGEGVADLVDGAVAKAGLARFVVVLCLRDVGLSERCECGRGGSRSRMTAQQPFYDFVGRTRGLPVLLVRSCRESPPTPRP
jgi:hypothetical protein